MSAPELPPLPWACPWGICNAEDAQKCRASMGTTKRTRGCGTYFPASTTPEQAKQMIRAPATALAEQKAEPSAELDLRCNCERCTKRTQETYTLPAYCTNCDWTGSALLRKGDEPSSATDCPKCGVSFRMQFRALKGTR